MVVGLGESLTVELIARIGELGSQVANVAGQNTVILGQQEHMTRALERASDNRGELHKKMDSLTGNVTERLEDVRKSVSALDTRLTIAEQAIDEFSPIIERVEVVRHQQAGVRNFFTRGRLVTAGVISAAGAAGGAWHQWSALTKFVSSLLKVKT